jgi:hypothetical protein
MVATPSHTERKTPMPASSRLKSSWAANEARMTAIEVRP